MIAALLLGWRLAFPSIIIGFYLSIQFYQYFFGTTNFEVQFGSPEFILIYIIAFTGTTILIFLKPQQEYLEYKEIETKSLKRENSHAKREILNLSQGFTTLQTQFDQKEEKLTEKESHLKKMVGDMQHQLSQIDGLKDDFLRNLQHESNTPMTDILSNSDILFSAYDTLDSKIIKSTIRDIITGSERLKTYISNIVDTSRLSKAGDSRLDEVKKVNLSDMVKERTISYKKVFSDDQHKAQFKLDIDPNLIVECNEYYITQLLDNLIINADKYGKNSLIEVSLRKMNSIMIEFKITDHGVGIPQEEIHDVFKSFTVSSNTKTPAGGRGLGLSLCQKIVDVHKGKILAESDKKNGTTFMFVIPFSYHYKV